MTGSLGVGLTELGSWVTEGVELEQGGGVKYG